MQIQPATVDMEIGKMHKRRHMMGTTQQEKIGYQRETLLAASNKHSQKTLGTNQAA